MRRRLGWLAGIIAIAYIIWAVIEAANPLHELEEPYPHLTDDEVDDLPYADPYLNELWLIAHGKRSAGEGGALIPPFVAQELLDNEVRWRRGEFPLQRMMARFRATD